MFLIFLMKVVLYMTFFDFSICLAKMVFHRGSTVIFLKQSNVTVLFFSLKVKCIIFKVLGDVVLSTQTWWFLLQWLSYIFFI